MNKKTLSLIALLIAMLVLVSNLRSASADRGRGDGAALVTEDGDSAELDPEFADINREAAAIAERLGGQAAVVEGLPVSEQLQAAFGHLSERQVPSGILLEAGSVFFDTAIQQHNGTERANAPALNYARFSNLYGDLTRSTLSVKLPSTSELDTMAMTIRDKTDANPIVLAVIDYDTIGAENISEKDFMDGVYQTRNEGQVGKTQRFVAAAALGSTLWGPQGTFVIPSELVITNGIEPSAINNIEVQFEGGPAQPVRLDAPFVSSVVRPGAESQVKFTIRFDVKGDGTHTTDGTVTQATTRGAGDCYDMPSVTSTVPHFVPDAPAGYTSPFGTIDLRIITSEGDVTGHSSGTNGDGCYTGGQPELSCALVIVTGFDEVATEGFNQVMAAFGDSIDQFIDIGYDIVLVDYQNGRDYIQRNGLAVREFLVNTLPGWMGENQECVVVMGASLGTQTARYGMTTAENAGEDHNVGLFINLDGPYQGANIPTGMQAAMDFMAPEVDALEDLLPILDSPAASQLLIKNRQMIQIAWFQIPMYYTPKDEFIDYFNVANALGLPDDSRNVSVANGSGTGTLQNNGTVQLLGSVDWDGPLWTGVKIRARTDHNGQVFYGKIQKLFSSRKMTLTLNNADFIDIDPGGTGELHKFLVDIAEDAGYPASYQLDTYNFVPTPSANGALFDAEFAHKCNTEHVRGSIDEAKAYIGAELVAFINGSAPPSPPQYENPCGQPEPGDPLPPTAVCSVSPNFGVGIVYAQFDGTASSDPDGNIVSYHWDYDDNGSWGIGPTPSHVFVNTGDTPEFHNIKLTVTDDDGMTDIDFCFVEVLCTDSSPWDPSCYQ